MKTLNFLSICLTVFALGGNFLFAQGSAAAGATERTPVMVPGEPKKPTFEKRVYVDEKENTYIQKSLPLYIKFSTSPDKNAKNYTLNSKRSAQYANPMYLDTEGINWIRSRWAVDPVTLKKIYPEEEIMYEIYADGITPQTSLKYNSEDVKKYVSKDGRVYYGAGLVVSLVSEDRVSGVDNIHLSLNGKKYENYKEPISFDNKEGNHTIYYFSNDMVGNSEPTNVKKFSVDLSPPLSTFEILSFDYKKRSTPKLALVLKAEDKFSGVKKSWYAVDQGERKVYDGHSLLMNYKEGEEREIFFHSVDNLGNEEEGEVISLVFNGISPILNAVLDGDKHTRENITYISERTNILMVGKHPLAKKEDVFYRIDDGEEVKYTGPFHDLNGTGFHNIAYYSQYYEPHKSFINVRQIFLDNVPPSSGIFHGEPQFFTRDTLFITSQTPVTLTPVDEQSGVKLINYIPFPGQLFEYIKPFHLHEEGHYELKFYSTDNVNNVEPTKVSELYVDNTPPVIYINFSIKPIGSKKKGGKTLPVYPNYTRMYIGATDGHTGTDRIFYSMDGDQLLEYSSPETMDVSELSMFKKSKFYKVRVIARDMLGNQGERFVEFFVEK